MSAKTAHLLDDLIENKQEVIRSNFTGAIVL